MTNGIILAKKSTWTSKLDINYLDETSLVKRKQCEEVRIGRKLEQFADYASKEELGAVRVAGFLHNRVALNGDGSFTHPGNLDNEERKRRIVREWRRVLQEPTAGRGARNDVVQHRLVLSMSNEMHAACLQKGLNPDQVLHESMRNVMRKFGEKFHPGDRIAYAYGFHHDTDNLHVHIALCPRTANGNYVGFSTPKKASNPSHHRDQMGFVRERCAHENRRWGKLLGETEQVNQFADRRHANRWLVSPRHSEDDFRQALTNRDVEGMELNRMYGELQKLHYRMEQLAARQRQAVLDGCIARLFRVKKVKPAIREASKESAREMSLLRRQFCRLRAVYLSHYHAHSQQEITTTNYAYRHAKYQQRRQARQTRQARGVSIRP